MARRVIAGIAGHAWAILVSTGSIGGSAVRRAGAAAGLGLATGLGLGAGLAASSTPSAGG